MHNIKFGTSGFRGIIGDNWTKENIQRIGAALCQIAQSQNKKTNIIIGFDNRFMGRESAEWFCESFCTTTTTATFMTVPVPTPYIVYKAVTADFGVMITASHNAHQYNGIKIFTRGGKDIDDEFCTNLMHIIGAENNTGGLNPSAPPADFGTLVKSGIVTLSDNTDDYVNKICSLVDIPKIKSSGMRVLFNPMHGSSANIMKQLFQKFGLEYHAINNNPDPLFGGGMPAPYPYLLTSMAEAVKGKYHLGIALDGDGDRITVIDSNGLICDVNYLTSAIFYFLTQIKKQKGGAVKSFVTSNLIVKVCKEYDRDVHETLPGFKYMGKAMHQYNALMATESNGGMAFGQVSFSKDAVTAAAVIIDMVAAFGKGVDEILAQITGMMAWRSEYLEFAYPFSASAREGILQKLLSPNKPTLPNIVKIDNFSDGFKIRLENDYWCAARVSGTENAMRLYTEMPSQSDCQALIKTLEKFYGLTERQK